MNPGYNSKEALDRDLGSAKAILSKIGITLDPSQPQLSGERYLMTRSKLVLLGNDQNGKKVIIKISNKNIGVKEIDKEKSIRDTLLKISFARESLILPEIFFYSQKEGYRILVTEYIPQDIVFPARTLEEQFFLSLRIFEEQELFHATTLEHKKSIQNVFDVYEARDYLKDFEGFIDNAKKLYPENKSVLESFESAYKILETNSRIIDKYTGYLAHNDLAPGNTRINGDDVYLLDLSAMHFGCKYEGWARFMNWSIVHSDKLEFPLLEYVEKNRGGEESLCLRLMRIFKAAYLVDYYIRSHGKTEKDLKILTEKRLLVWTEILKHLTQNTNTPKSVIEKYREERNSLRSKEETERQKEINIPEL